MLSYLMTSWTIGKNQLCITFSKLAIQFSTNFYPYI